MSETTRPTTGRPGLSPAKQALLEKLKRGGVAGTGPIRRRGPDAPVAASFAQQRLVLLDQLIYDRATYNLPLALRLAGALDVGALERAIQEVARRHEALRTTFRIGVDPPEQVVAPELHVTLPVGDLSRPSAAEREEEAGRRVEDEARRHFDLSAGPLFRGLLLRLSAEEHVLLLCMHHVVSDGWSMGVLQREISALYGAFSRGGPSPLPDLPVQYPDYALWQRERLSGEALDRQLAYWRERLAGAPAVLELPTDRPRPIMQVYHGAVHQGRLPGELRRELRALAQREGGTLFMVLIAAFKVLLSRYSEQQDLVVGTPVAGREHAEVEGLVGFFVNTLALRTDLSGEPTFTELLARVRETSLGAFAHADVPFERLLAELRPERTLNRQPLFQAMFGLQNTPRASFQVEGLVARPFPLRTTTAKFDLTLMVGEDEGGIETRIEYSTELFDPRTIERLGEHYRVLLEGILAGPGRRIPELPLLTPEEWQRVVVERNATGRECPRGCMQTLFQEQAARTPHVPAVAWDGGGMSYSELDLRSNRLAHALRGYGVGPEVRVGIWLERGPDMVVSLLAVLKAGGAYVPVDPAYPRERTACVLRDSGVRVLLTQDRFRDRLPEHAARVIRVDGDRAEIGRQSATAPRVEVAPDNLAYVIYTSGSTGTPKGVMVPHGGLANYLAWASGAYAPGTRGGAPVHSSLSFDLTVTSLLVPLVRGGCVVLVPEEEGVEALAAAVRAGRECGLVKLTPTHLSLLRQELPAAEAAASGCTFVVGGEALDAGLVSAWRRSARGARIFNEYGPTEAVVGCVACEVPPVVHPGGSVPIGRPIANVRVYVLGAALVPTPEGAPGELYVGGVQVARGYLGRPELTAERFLPDPFSAEPGARLYRTGDRVRWRADGMLEFLGRVDEQVKLRGFRIEPGEVEHVLRRHPGVREAVVVAREDAPGDVRLVAYLVPEGMPAPAEELRGFLGERLPAYMVPARFVTLEALPLGPSGKLDRGALPVPEGQAGTGRHFVGPRSPMEAKLAEIWAEVLGVERVGIHDDLFALGGHSLLAAQAVSRTRQAFGVERLTLRALLPVPTVAEFAGRVEEALRDQAGGAASPR